MITQSTTIKKNYKKNERNKLYKTFYKHVHSNACLKHSKLTFIRYKYMYMKIVYIIFSVHVSENTEWSGSLYWRKNIRQLHSCYIQVSQFTETSCLLCSIHYWKMLSTSVCICRGHNYQLISIRQCYIYLPLTKIMTTWNIINRTAHRTIT